MRKADITAGDFLFGRCCACSHPVCHPDAKGLAAACRWLAPGGLLFPCEATLYLAAAGPPGDKTGPNFWRDVYGYNMQPIGDMERERDSRIAAVAPVDPQHLISQPCLIRAFDLSTLTLEQTELSQAFELELLPEQVRSHMLTAL